MVPVMMVPTPNPGRGAVPLSGQQVTLRGPQGLAQGLRPAQPQKETAGATAADLLESISV